MAFVLDVVLWSCSLVCVIEFGLLSLVLFLDLVVLFLLCCWYVSCVLVRFGLDLCSCALLFNDVLVV